MNQEETTPPEPETEASQEVGQAPAEPPFQAPGGYSDAVPNSSLRDYPGNFVTDPSVPQQTLAALLRIEALVQKLVDRAPVHFNPILKDAYEAEYDAAGYEETRPKREAARKKKLPAKKKKGKR